jgi:hypothetical protein
VRPFWAIFAMFKTERLSRGFRTERDIERSQSGKTKYSPFKDNNKQTRRPLLTGVGTSQPALARVGTLTVPLQSGGVPNDDLTRLRAIAAQFKITCYHI